MRKCSVVQWLLPEVLAAAFLFPLSVRAETTLSPGVEAGSTVSEMLSDPGGDDARASGQSAAPEGNAQNAVLPETVAAVTFSPEGESLSAGETVTLRCETEGASIIYAVSQDGETYSDFLPYTQPIPMESGFGKLSIRARATKAGWADGPESVAEFSEKTPEPGDGEKNDGRKWNLYFGLLHAHTNLSDGLGSVEDAFSTASAVEGLDFFAVTDHSDSFDNASAGSIGADGTKISTEWAAGKAAAAAVTNDRFVGMFGYEMSWPELMKLGHINTFHTPGWQAWNQDGFLIQPTALEEYYQVLASVPDSVSQFNHPGSVYGDFEGFSHYSPEADDAISLLEVGGEGDFTAYDAYTQALDRGWHVAPTNNQNNHQGNWGMDNSHRTVLLADSLTEASLYDAMKNRRAYATEDSDLSIYYTLNGQIMGSVITGGETLQIRAELEEPTDAVIGEVAVIGDGGAVIDTRQVEKSSETLELTVPKGFHYYYLRITQPDGNIAVTAPVWVKNRTEFGIEEFSVDTQVPTSGKPLNITLKLYNREDAAFEVQSVRFTADGKTVDTSVGQVTVGNDGFTCTVPYTHTGAGTVTLKVEVTGTMEGETRLLEETLTLRFRVPEQTTKILVDGSHGNMGTDTLSRLTAIAAQAGVTVEKFTGSLPMDGSVLLIGAPTEGFKPEFVKEVAEFSRSGGTVFLCGQGDMGDLGNVHSSAELNRLLSAMGVSMRFYDDTAWDKENNGGTPDALYTTVCNRNAQWLTEVTDEQLYSQHAGCTVDAGSGTWLVQGLPTTGSMDLDGDGGGAGRVLLAWEKTSAGGDVVIAGGNFLADEELKEAKNKWDPVSVNQMVLEKLLNIHRDRWPVSDISQVRQGEAGQVYRVRGWATSGTSRPGNIFPETLYLQDETGGIALMPVTETGIQIGTPIEAVGALEFQQGNPVLNLTDYQILKEDYYRFAPKTTSHKDAMDYGKNGGKLMQVEGQVTAFTLTEDEKGVSRITLKDKKGDLAQVLIEPYIVSGTGWENKLASQVKQGRTVRAMGILHLDSDGTPVLLVRNCDEVVYVPPVPVPSMIPYTGDPILAPMSVMLCSGVVLLALRRKKKR